MSAPEVSLAELKDGDTAQLMSFGQMNDAYRQRLLAMGLICGAKFKIIRRAPLGDPIQIKVHATNLSVRLSEAKTIRVKRIHEK